MTETTNNKSYDEFDVSDAWKNKFKILEKAGKFKGVSYENYKSLNRKERQKIGFNILAFIFSYFYYFSKKMHYKGAFILGATFIFSGFMILIETSVGMDFPSVIYWIPPSAVVASIANYDYFKFITKNEIMWDKFPKIFSSVVGAIAFPLVAIIFLLATSGIFSNFGVPSCSDTITTNLVKEITYQEMTKALGAENVKRLSYTVNAIRTKSTDEQTGFHKCSAQLGIINNNTQKSKEAPITYTVEKTDDGKEVYVSVFGL